MRRVDLQVNRSPVDALVVTRDSRRLRLDLPPNLVKVVVSAPRLMQELSKLWVLGNSFWGVRLDAVGPILRRYVDKLEDQWATSNDA